MQEAANPEVVVRKPHYISRVRKFGSGGKQALACIAHARDVSEGVRHTFNRGRAQGPVVQSQLPLCTSTILLECSLHTTSPILYISAYEAESVRAKSGTDEEKPPKIAASCIS